MLCSNMVSALMKKRGGKNTKELFLFIAVMSLCLAMLAQPAVASEDSLLGQNDLGRCLVAYFENVDLDHDSRLETVATPEPSLSYCHDP
ncbi:MAG: hypothetical protein WCX16_06170, partial [Candidatus Omnitrophota bacterium]